ncbi:hypothetical protein [Sediminicola sp. 1XM1-17]|uniref:hypothetical protein n=1 Tax=Sediminicola sp. 1XM1-17 TaxID=3127702 RepID=UPI0030772A4F
MKSIQTYILISLLLGTAFTSCRTQKTLQGDVPFVMGAATSQEWIGGREESGTGISVVVPISAISKNVSFQDMYFRGQIVQVSTDREGEGLTVQGNFKKVPKEQGLFTPEDPKREMGGQQPPLSGKAAQDFPFDLTFHEAVLSYIVKNRMKYVKISGIKEKAVLIYSTKPKN